MNYIWTGLALIGLMISGVIGIMISMFIIWTLKEFSGSTKNLNDIGERIIKDGKWIWYIFISTLGLALLVMGFMALHSSLWGVK